MLGNPSSIRWSLLKIPTLACTVLINFKLMIEVECKEIKKSENDQDHAEWANRCIFVIGSELVGNPYMENMIYEEASCDSLHSEHIFFVFFAI